MAYNLESLVRIINNVLNPDQNRWILDRHHTKPQLESLLEKACSLKQVLEGSVGSEVESLDSQIRDAAHRAEDVIESHMVDQILLEPKPDLKDVIEDFSSALQEMMKTTGAAHHAPSSSWPGPSITRGPVSSTSILVGLDEDMDPLKERLVGEQSRLGILPIVGMGGIGKTTLARHLYNDPLVTSHYDTRAWITISQDYDVRAILVGLLDCTIGKLSNDIFQQGNDRLGLKLHQSLCGRRYLIVLDDIWSLDAWDKIRRFFPKDKENTGSCIIVTTRESNVAKNIDSQSRQHEMHLLSEDKSWMLLREKLFGEGECDPQLEKIGQKIASNCRGLPLAIDVIGGVLKEGKGLEDVWQHIANDVSSAIAEKDDHFSKILSLSYDHLPNHLRPCFLYVGAFPEDYEIRASKLVKLWVAEGFLKSIGAGEGDKSLEEAGEEYLKALVDRNLLSVRQKKSNGKGKSFAIHDLLRDLCLRKSSEEKFLYSLNRNVPESFNSLRSISVRSSSIEGFCKSRLRTPLARSFLCIGTASVEILPPVLFALRLLRVLDVLDIVFPQFPTEVLVLVNLRYLAFSCRSSLPCMISRLRNLQTLILRLKGNKCYLPCAVWELPELRHVKVKNRRIQHGFEIEYYKKSSVHEKLQTISVIDFQESKRGHILANVPNIKRLGIYVSCATDDVDLSHLNKLETLKCSSDSSTKGSTYLAALTLPPSIKKLTLSHCKIPWRLLTNFGALPSLEVLKVQDCVLGGPEWEQPTEEEESFRSLQFLLFDKLIMVCWPANLIDLRRLRRLVIRGCTSLEEIPPEIGDITTLETIELYGCQSDLEASARRIVKERRREYGCDDLRLCISGVYVNI